MSLEVLRKIIEAHPDIPDDAFGFVAHGGLRMVGDNSKALLGRVLSSVIVAACDEIPIEKLDKKAKEIRAGSATFMREQSTPEKAETCLSIVPIGYLRHLVALGVGIDGRLAGG